MSLAELLVALSILVIVTASTVLMFRSITRAWRTGELRTERYQQARLLFDLFERELTSAVANARYPFIARDAADVAPRQEGSAQDELLFVGTLPGRAGLVERAYWVVEEGTLYCHDDEPADGDYATGEREACGRDVAGLELSFYDGAAWLPRWDGQAGAAQAGQLPNAVRITLTLGKQRPESFETVVHVPTS